MTCYPQHVYSNTDHLNCSLQDYRVERNLSGYSVFRNTPLRISWWNFAQARVIRILCCSDDPGPRQTCKSPWRNLQNTAVCIVCCILYVPTVALGKARLSHPYPNFLIRFACQSSRKMHTVWDTAMQWLSVWVYECMSVWVWSTCGTGDVQYSTLCDTELCGGI
jgi:hypothetical protein